MSAHEQVGFSCPQCGGRMDTKDSRPTTFREEKSVRRRRHCRGCSFRITTFEVVDRAWHAEVKIIAMREAMRRAADALQALLALNDAIDQELQTEQGAASMLTANGATQ